MSAHLTESQLNDYAEGLLDEPARRWAAEHLATCSACRSAVAGIRSIRDEAHRLQRPSHTPDRDLWPAIEARIREKEVLKRTGSDGGPRPFRQRPFLLAAAALVLVSLSSALALTVARGGVGGPENGTPGGISVAEEAPAGGSPATAAFAAGREMEAAFEPTIEELGRALEANRDQLEPQTVQVVEESLRIIDEAIEEAMAALAADPASRAATGSLRTMYDTKVQVLQRAVALARGA